MIIKSLIESDIQNLHKLQPDGWPDIVPAFEYYLTKPFFNPVKITIDNRIAGIGSGNSLENTAWLSHIIVSQEFRNIGIGFSIVNHLKNLMEKSGCETVSLIATESGYPVYKRAGFTEQSEYIFFEREKPLKNYNQSKNIFRFSEINTNPILYLDKKISGEDRSKILIEKLKESYVYKKNGEITGFYIPESGEGMIVSDTTEAGIELMKLRYTSYNKGVIPAENIEGIDFLKKNGFIEKGRARRMISGKEFIWNPEGIYNRIGGNFG